MTTRRHLAIFVLLFINVNLITSSPFNDDTTINETESATQELEAGADEELDLDPRAREATTEPSFLDKVFNFFRLDSKADDGSKNSKPKSYNNQDIFYKGNKGKNEKNDNAKPPKNTPAPGSPTVSRQDVPAIPATPETPSIPDTPETPDVPETPEVPSGGKENPGQPEIDILTQQQQQQQGNGVQQQQQQQQEISITLPASPDTDDPGYEVPTKAPKPTTSKQKGKGKLIAN